MPGGKTVESPKSALEKVLSAIAFRHLLDARRELAEMLALPPGPDLGFADMSPGLKFMPAYQRYTGRIYASSHINMVYPRVEGKKLLIISALYGILDAGDFIRNYDLQMKENLPNGRVLYTWWKNQGLGQILCEAIRQLSPQLTHDLLSGDYRKAVAPWPDCTSLAHLHKHEYPGLGTGSNHYRGKDLERLLLEK
jgi:cytoplasmic iron level regulating protein YaaA (DUF328/UPF0246 family)